MRATTAFRSVRLRTPLPGPVARAPSRAGRRGRARPVFPLLPAGCQPGVTCHDTTCNDSASRVLSVTPSMIVTRFAPSPTGRLHLGHAYRRRSAMRRREAKRRQVPAADRGSRPGALQAGVRRWHLRGPALAGARMGRAGAGPVAADGGLPGGARRLKARGLVYACFCTRADIAQSLTAPHGDAATSYPGTCRGLPDDPERRATTPHCWRLDSPRRCELPGCRLDRGRRQQFERDRERHRRRDPRPQGCAGLLSSVLRRRRCGRAA